MPDPLDALRKAQSIQPAPPDRGYFSADTEHPYLNAATDVLKGLTGLGDQGPSGMTATNFGQLLGAAIPFAGLRKAGAGPRIAEDLMDEIGHRFTPGPIPVAPPPDAPAYTQAFIQHLNETGPGEMDPMAFVRNSAVTSLHSGLPPQEIKIPKGFTVQGGHGYLPLASTDQWADQTLKLRPKNGGQDQRQMAIQYLKETGLPAPTNNATPWQTDTINSVRSPEELNLITHAPQRNAPPLSGMNVSGIRRGPSPISDDIVRDIRQATQDFTPSKGRVGRDAPTWASLANDLSAKHGIKITPDTLRSIANRTSFQWVK